jgi:hypothetical protein
MSDPEGAGFQSSVDNVKLDNNEEDPKSSERKKKVHLVILTHGLHSNLGADMLFLKESIDSATRSSHQKAHKSNNPHVNPTGSDNLNTTRYVSLPTRVMMQSSNRLFSIC